MSTSNATVSSTINAKPLYLTPEKISKEYSSGDKYLFIMEDKKSNIHDINLLCEFLDANPQITALCLKNCSLTGDAISPIANNSTIDILFLINNRIGDTGAKALSQNNTITRLHVCNNNIGPIGARALAQNKIIKYLHVGNNNIGNEGAVAFSQNKTFIELNVSDNNIGDAGFIALARHKSVKELRIYGNPISHEGAKLFIDDLNKNTSLIRLWGDNKNLEPFSNTKNRIIQRNKNLPSLQQSITNVHLFLSAQKLNECLLGTIPIELTAIINSYVVGKNHYAFFMNIASGKPKKEAFLESARAAVNMSV
jgi:Leucine Rich repeat